MKSILSIACAALIFLAPLVLDAQEGAGSWSETEKIIWALEEQYMSKIQKGDLDGLSPFWHEGFLGWPSHSARPVDRPGTIASLEALAASTKFLAFELNPHAIRITGKVAVVHYTVTLDAELSDGKRAWLSYRITHTWLEEDGRWQILGGMSAVVGGTGS